MNSASPPLRIVILGGGSAGWITACLMAKAWSAQRIQIILVESREIGTIGVGEGSTPQLKAFFDALGVDEHVWMMACHATYKHGIRFKGWSDRPGFGSYFHPFPTSLDRDVSTLFFRNTLLRRQGLDVWAHPDRFFLSGQLAGMGRLPVSDHADAPILRFGYHFDAALLGSFLKHLAVSRFGVTWLERTVLGVQTSENGQIKGLLASNGEAISGDFFIDCSGFASQILQSTLHEPFISSSEMLFNDRAVVVQTPLPTQVAAPETRSVAMNAGWRWQIPLTSRVGNGYVYSSAFLSADEADFELRSSLGLLDGKIAARHLTMKVGAVRRSWVGNCLAVGLSQGFLEPLEATALHMVLETVQGFIAAFEKGRFTYAEMDAFNRSISRRFAGIQDYIVGHYKINHRQDNEYWRNNAEQSHFRHAGSSHRTMARRPSASGRHLSPSD